MNFISGTRFDVSIFQSIASDFFVVEMSSFFWGIWIDFFSVEDRRLEDQHDEDDMCELCQIFGSHAICLCVKRVMQKTIGPLSFN